MSQWSSTGIAHLIPGGSTFAVRDFDWRLKVVLASDSCPSQQTPLVQLVFHALQQQPPLVYEFDKQQVTEGGQCFCMNRPIRFAYPDPIVPAGSAHPAVGFDFPRDEMSAWIYPRLRVGEITRSTVLVLLGGGTAFGLTCAYKWLSGNERFYTNQVMPTLHRWVDCEHSHRLAVTAARLGLLPRFGANHCEYPELSLKLWDWQLRNPIGLAAGFDKDGEAVARLRETGFGFVEIGTVTPLPQPGNARPRIFRLVEDRGVINRYGFNSAGADAVADRLRTLVPGDHPVPLGVNIGRNKTSTDGPGDFETGVDKFGQLADYLVVNVSSPNTPGLRRMQAKGELEHLMKAVKTKVQRLQRPPKILLKIAPDLSLKEMLDIAEVCLDSRYGVDGVIVANTSISRPKNLKSEARYRIGGLSGQPIKEMTTHCIRVMYRFTEGRVPIIGCGGVASGADAYEKIRAGASIVQLYTAIVFDGFPVIGKVKRELAELVRRDGFEKISDCVGLDNRW